MSLRVWAKASCFRDPWGMDWWEVHKGDGWGGGWREAHGAHGWTEIAWSGSLCRQTEGCQWFASDFEAGTRLWWRIDEAQQPREMFGILVVFTPCLRRGGLGKMNVVKEFKGSSYPISIENDWTIKMIEMQSHPAWNMCRLTCVDCVAISDQGGSERRPLGDQQRRIQSDRQVWHGGRHAGDLDWFSRDQQHWRSRHWWTCGTSPIHSGRIRWVRRTSSLGFLAGLSAPSSIAVYKVGRGIPWPQLSKGLVPCHRSQSWRCYGHSLFISIGSRNWKLWISRNVAWDRHWTSLCYLGFTQGWRCHLQRELQ